MRAFFASTQGLSGASKRSLSLAGKSTRASAETRVANETDRNKKQQFHRLQQTPEERKERREPLLKQAERSLAEYCSVLPEDSEDSEKCWAAYNYFEKRKEAAESGCEVDYLSGTRSGPDCSKLESFESFVRQLVGQAPMSSFAHMLYTLNRAELHNHQNEQPMIAEVEHEDGAVHFELKNVPKSGKARLIAFFEAMDKDGNGKLDTAEFREAMAKLGMQHLTGQMVSTILSAMDIHGPITLEDFLQIVEAEELYSDTPVSRWLRARRGESKFWGEPV